MRGSVLCAAPEIKLPRLKFHDNTFACTFTTQLTLVQTFREVHTSDQIYTLTPKYLIRHSFTYTRMPYIDKSGQVKQGAPFKAKLIELFWTIWNLIKLFWATLSGENVDNAVRRTTKRRNYGDESDNGRPPNRSSDFSTLNRRNGPTVKGLYGEAPCCGR